MHYSLIVLGGGTAGLRTALAAAHKGHETALIEPGVLGGTCLNTGCIPTKAMLQAAHVYKSMHETDVFGVTCSSVRLDFPKLMKRVRSIVNEGQDHIGVSVERCPHLTVLKSRASFCGKNALDVNGKRITADKIIISTGAKNIIVPIPGLEDAGYITNETVFSMKKLPKSIILIGGGYISMEFATFFAHLGCDVTVLERAPQVLGTLDDDIVNTLLESYSNVRIITCADIIEIKKTAKGKMAVVGDVEKKHASKKRIVAEEVFCAIGRSPNTAGLACETAGIQLGPRGNIEVNNHLRTTNPHVYAIGDVTGRPMFAHAAKRESMIALQNALDGKRLAMDFDLIPWAVFTDPPVAGVGLTEKQAPADAKLGVLHAPFKKAGRSTIMNDTRGFVKVLYDTRNDRVLGATIIGPRADDLIHEFAILLHSKSPTLDVLRQTIHVHPTLSEVMDALQ